MKCEYDQAAFNYSGHKGNTSKGGTFCVNSFVQKEMDHINKKYIVML